MEELYERFKEMLMDHQHEVMNKKAEFNKEIKGLTKDAREYKLQLDGYNEELTRNINKINERLKKIKRE